jgi:hypothetical protein
MPIPMPYPDDAEPKEPVRKDGTAYATGSEMKLAETKEEK